MIIRTVEVVGRVLPALTVVQVAVVNWAPVRLDTSWITVPVGLHGVTVLALPTNLILLQVVYGTVTVAVVLARDPKLNPVLSQEGCVLLPLLLLTPESGLIGLVVGVPMIKVILLQVVYGPVLVLVVVLALVILMNIVPPQGVLSLLLPPTLLLPILPLVPVGVTVIVAVIRALEECVGFV